MRWQSSPVLPASVVEDEERATTRYLTLTTIAIFFSSITATTLQFSYQQTTTRLDKSVNLLWFASLIFSISSGINSLLSMLWRRSIVWVQNINLHLTCILSFVFEGSQTLRPLDMWRYGLLKHRSPSSLSLQCRSSLDWIVSASLLIRWASSSPLTDLFIYQCAPGKQGGAVSIATIALTAVHIIGIIAMLAWFVARLEWNKTYFLCIRRNILWWVDSLQ